MIERTPLLNIATHAILLFGLGIAFIPMWLVFVASTLTIAEINSPPISLIPGDQLFVNAYLLACTVFARQGTLSGSRFARYAAEIMAVESVHRALALQSLGKLGNDRAYAKFGQKEEVQGLPTTGDIGLYRAADHVTALEAAGFGFGKPGKVKGTKFEYDEVSKRTPTDPDVNTLTPS